MILGMKRELSHKPELPDLLEPVQTESPTPQRSDNKSGKILPVQRRTTTSSTRQGLNFQTEEVTLLTFLETWERWKLTLQE